MKYKAKMPDGTLLTRKSRLNFEYIGAVKFRGQPWGWVRWSATFEGAERAVRPYKSLPDLEMSYVGLIEQEG